MKRALIVAGGELDQEALLETYHLDDLLIAADAGVLALLELGLTPNVAIGDFDTTGRGRIPKWEEMGIEIHALSPEKDITDTHAAVEYAISQGIQEILLFAALGGARFDHTLANIQLLEWSKGEGAEVVIVHQHNRIHLLRSGESKKFPKTDFQYLSLLPVTDVVKGISAEGVLYPLDNEKLVRGYTRGISNEWKGEVATLSLQKGICLVIEAKDGKNVSLF